MRRLACLALAATSFAAAAPPEFVRVSPRDPRYLELSSGAPYIPIGLNMLDPPTDLEEAKQWQIYEGWLDQLAAAGGNYIRVWLSRPFWDVEHERSGVYDEALAKRIDRLLALAQARGIRVKMTLEHFRSIGDGPQKWADKPLHHVSNGGTAQSIADFFDGQASRDRFRAKIRWYASRFGDQPTVYGWELWNEINAVRGGDYMAWTEAMLPELRAAFPKNLVMQSLGSFDTDTVRETYRRHSTLRGNDVAQVHRYLDLGARMEICHGPVDVLAADAVRELIGYQPGKPVILAESGAVEPRHAGPFQLYGKDRDGMLLHDVLFAPFFAGAAGPGQIWHWNVYVAPNNLWWHYRRFADVVKGLDPTAEKFEPSVREDGHVRIYELKGKKTTLLWYRDTRNTWQAELRDGRAPEVVAGVTLEVPKGIRRVRFYDPWTGKWTESARAATVKAPEFRRSLVVRLER